MVFCLIFKVKWYPKYNYCILFNFLNHKKHKIIKLFLKMSTCFFASFYLKFIFNFFQLFFIFKKNYKKLKNIFFRIIDENYKSLTQKMAELLEWYAFQIIYYCMLVSLLQVILQSKLTSVQLLEFGQLWQLAAYLIISYLDNIHM